MQNYTWVLDPTTCALRDIHVRTQSSGFNLGAKANGQKFTKRIAGPPQAKEIPKDRQADWVVQDKTTPEQATIYRLSGDYNGLHISTSSARCQILPVAENAATAPEIGQATGFGGVILHGLSTFGFAARAVVSAVGGGRPESLRFFGVRFTSPVKPGDRLETSIWGSPLGMPCPRGLLGSTKSSSRRL